MPHVPHRDRHGGGRQQSGRHGSGAEQDRVRAVAKRGDPAKLRALQKAAQAVKKPKRRGDIDLESTNKMDYKKDGCNVQLSPIPKLWTHEDLRRLLQRVNAPCPIAWNLQAAKGLAWIDYNNRKHQRDAIEALNNLQMPGGLTLAASPVDVEKKKKPAFYRDCDDGRVLPTDLSPKQSQKRPALDTNMVEMKAAGVLGTSPAAAAEAIPPAKRVKGRGFAAFAGTVIRTRADGAEEEAVPTTRAVEASKVTEERQGDGYLSDSSSSSGASSHRSVQQALATANAGLLAKYKVILKRLTEKKRSKGTDVDLSDAEDST